MVCLFLKLSVLTSHFCVMPGWNLDFSRCFLYNFHLCKDINNSEALFLATPIILGSDTWGMQLPHPPSCGLIPQAFQCLLLQVPCPGSALGAGKRPHWNQWWNYSFIWSSIWPYPTDCQKEKLFMAISNLFSHQLFFSWNTLSFLFFWLPIKPKVIVKIHKGVTWHR